MSVFISYEYELPVVRRFDQSCEQTNKQQPDETKEVLPFYLIRGENAGWTTSRSGHPCPCHNCAQWPPTEKTGRGSLLNRRSWYPRRPNRSNDWTETFTWYLKFNSSLVLVAQKELCFNLSTGNQHWSVKTGALWRKKRRRRRRKKCIWWTWILFCSWDCTDRIDNLFELCLDIMLFGQCSSVPWSEVAGNKDFIYLFTFPLMIRFFSLWFEYTSLWIILSIRMHAVYYYY